MLASGGTPAFARVLKSALAPGAAVEVEGETPAIELAERQKLAGDGKGLPEALERDAGEGETDKTLDVAFAWFGMSLVLPQPAPALPKLPAGAAPIALPEGQAPATPLPAGTQLAADPDPTPVVPEAPAQDAVAIDLKGPAAPVAPLAGPEATPPLPAGTPEVQPVAERPAGPIRIELPRATETPQRIQPVTLAAIQPRAEAVQPLAAPLAAAAIETPSPRRQAPRDATVSALSAPTAEAPRAHAVPAAADAQQPALDLRNRDAMTSMIERIEALRDMPGARETSIRLSPDALGTVDVSIRREGDRVHVHFSAETPAARAALAEAQPRLAELAESRGLRLGQTSVEGGAAGQGQRQDAAPRPAFATAPASAPGGEPATDTDERIA